MPSGGRIFVRANNVMLDEVSDPPLPAGNYLQIDFEDEGEGIAPEIQDNIFDPYFTTKDDGQGLGLTTVFSIIRKHDGFVTLRSSLGRTVFSLFLPACKEGEIHIDTDSIKVRDTGLMARKTIKHVRILIMDDEEYIRNLIFEILSLHEYQVIITKNTDEAVMADEECIAKGEKVDLMILDLTIPGGQGGAELIKVIHEKHPEAKAIAVSGYSENPVMSDFQTHGFAAALSKPFSVDELLDKVKDVLRS